MRLAVARAAIRRGWVWPIRPATPAAELEADLGQLGGLCPEPVSPQTITTWWSWIAAAISALALVDRQLGRKVGFRQRVGGGRSAWRPSRRWPGRRASSRLRGRFGNRRRSRRRGRSADRQCSSRRRDLGGRAGCSGEQPFGSAGLIQLQEMHGPHAEGRHRQGAEHMHGRGAGCPGVAGGFDEMHDPAEKVENVVSPPRPAHEQPQLGRQPGAEWQTTPPPRRSGSPHRLAARCRAAGGRTGVEAAAQPPAQRAASPGRRRHRWRQGRRECGGRDRTWGRFTPPPAPAPSPPAKGRAAASAGASPSWSAPRPIDPQERSTTPPCRPGEQMEHPAPPRIAPDPLGLAPFRLPERQLAGSRHPHASLEVADAGWAPLGREPRPRACQAPGRPAPVAPGSAAFGLGVRSEATPWRRLRGLPAGVRWTQLAAPCLPRVRRCRSPARALDRPYGAPAASRAAASACPSTPAQPGQRPPGVGPAPLPRRLEVLARLVEDVGADPKGGPSAGLVIRAHKMGCRTRCPGHQLAPHRVGDDRRRLRRAPGPAVRRRDAGRRFEATLDADRRLDPTSSGAAPRAHPAAGGRREHPPSLRRLLRREGYTILIGHRRQGRPRAARHPSAWT